MKRDLFRSMREQMIPSDDAKAALEERLAQPIAAKPHPWRKYAVLAACVALFVTAVPVSQALRAANQPPRQHSYVTADETLPVIVEQKNPFDVGTGHIGGGAESMPGGAAVGGDVAVQEGAVAYELLMKGLGGDLPDWYGGAYIDPDGSLTVLLVDRENPGDKSLELQVLEWTGSGRVAFSSAKYSQAYLSGLMDKLNEQLPQLVEDGSWSLDTANNRIDLRVSFPVDTKVLTALAELDPDDDAIWVSAYTEKAFQMEWKATIGQPGGDVDGNPDGYSAPSETYNALPAPISELPAEKATPASYDLLPLDEAE